MSVPFVRHVAYAAFTALTVTAPAISGAQSVVLGELYRELRTANPRITAADGLARAARARVPLAGVPSDPQLQIGYMNFDLTSLKPMDDVGMVQLQLMQMIPLGGKLGLARDVADARADAAADRAADVIWETRARTAMAFYDLYAADRAIGVMRESLRLLDDTRRTAESMYRVAGGRQVDVLRAQVEIARMTEDTIRMHAMRSAMAERLAAVLDRPNVRAVGTPAIPAFPATVPPLDSLEQRARAGRSMLKAAEDEIVAAERMGRLARGEYAPDLTLGVQYGVRRGTMPFTEPGAAIERRIEHMGSVMVGISLPVRRGEKQRRAGEEAGAMLAMAKAELTAMRADTRGRLGEVYAELVRARRLAALYRTTILPQAEVSSASALSAYRVGQVDFMTLLDGRMTVNTYRQELAKLEAEEGKAWAELEMLIGAELLDATRVTLGPSSAQVGGSQ